MGDLAQHIAEFARRAYPDSAIPASHTETIAAMAEACKKVALEIVELIEGRDLNVAAGIVSDDDTLDGLHAESYRIMLEDGYAATPQEILNMALVSRYFERFGDHAVGVSRRIVYLVTGDHTGDRADLRRRSQTRRRSAIAHKRTSTQASRRRRGPDRYGRGPVASARL